jgi:uncharacterized protein with von Willebrand factor type A (vWA) domain
MTDLRTIAIRPAGADDDAVLAAIAALDSARPLRRPAVLAVVDGRPVAAASVADGRIVADPFTPTADIVALLDRRVADVATTAARGSSRRRPVLRLPRLRPAI